MQLIDRDDDLYLKKLKSACKTEAFMKKKNEKRYFRILFTKKSGFMIVYTRTEKINEKLKGLFLLTQIENVQAKASELFIKIKNKDKTFILKGTSNQQIDEWKEKILFLIADQQTSQLEFEEIEYDEKNKTQNLCKQQIKDITILIESNQEDSVFQKYQQAQNKELINPRSESLSLSMNLRNQIVEQVQNSVQEKRLTKSNSQNQQYIDEQIFAQLGFQDLINQSNKRVYMNRIWYGNLEKRKQGGKIQNTMITRWFFLISAKSLNEDDNDEILFTQQDLPHNIQLDTLYQFKTKSLQPERCKTEYKMKNCVEIREKNMNESKKQGYVFQIDFGDQNVLYLLTPTEQARQSWIQVLTRSMETSKILENQNIKRNIDIILKTYDFELNSNVPLTDQQVRKQQIRNKIDQDNQNMKKQLDIKENLEQFIKWISFISNDLFDIIDSCKALDNPRLDIIEEYTQYQHENICNFLTQFWDNNWQQMNNLEILDICRLIHNYSEELKKYASEDKQLERGIATLIKVYFKKVEQNQQSLIQNVLNQQKKNSDILLDEEDGFSYSQTPSDILFAINSVYSCTLNGCTAKPVIWQLATFSKNSFLLYYSLLQDSIEDQEFNQNQLVNISNDANQFYDRIEELEQQFLSQYDIQQQHIDQYFDANGLKKEYNDIHEAALEFNQKQIFNQFSQILHKSQNFFELNIEKVVEELLYDDHNILKMYKSYHRNKIFQYLMKYLISFYFEIFLKTSKQKKKSSIEYIQKLEHDYDVMKGIYDDISQYQDNQEEIQPILEMNGFLKSTVLREICQHCRNLRKFFGISFDKQKVV